MAYQVKRSSIAGTLSLTPLIDVVFLLLIFFLVTSEFEDEERRLDIVLPTATSAAPMTARAREIVVDVDREGLIYLRGEPTSVDELARVFEAAVAKNPTNQTVVVRADQDVSFQPVVSVLDVCNRTGISDYSVTTKEAIEG